MKQPASVPRNPRPRSPKRGPKAKQPLELGKLPVCGDGLVHLSVEIRAYDPLRSQMRRVEVGGIGGVLRVKGQKAGRALGGAVAQAVAKWVGVEWT